MLMYHKKRITLALAALLAAGQALADGYGYFTLRQADGTATTLTAPGLKLTFADGKVLATQDGTTTTLPLSDLSAMFFATENTSTAIASPAATTSDGVTVYTLGGVRVAQATTLQGLNLPKGIYIVSQNGVKTKMTVR